MGVGSVFHCPDVNFLMTSFLALPFLEGECETPTRGNELTAGPRIFTSKVNLVLQNRAEGVEPTGTELTKCKT